MKAACPKCGTELPAEAQFCFKCGNRIGESEDSTERLQRYIPKELLAKLEAARESGGMQGERRVVTMLFCDVKGSTAAAEQLDAEEWTDVMNGAFERLIPPVYRYEGTLAKMMGDAILAFFGAPIAHEDDPQRAVLAGLDIVEGIASYKEEVRAQLGIDIDVRVGINTGLVVVGEVGSDMHVEYTALGDATNVAARMEQTAQPGTVQVAADTYRLVAPLFEAEDLGAQQVKGKSEPVQTYRIIGPKKEPASLRGIEGLVSPLIGRDKELASLKSALDELKRGRGQIVSLMGDAGLGKSRLISELREAAKAHDATNGALPVDIGWHEARSISYETSTVFAPFAGLLRRMLNLGDHDGYEAVKEGVRRLMPNGSSESAPFLSTMLDIDVTGEDLELVRHLQPPQLRDRVFGATKGLFERLASSKPQILVLEDVHWFDSSSLDLLEQMMALTDRVPLLMIGVFRPQRQEPSWRFHEAAARDYAHRYTALSLEPLDDEQSRDLVGKLLYVEELPEKVRALILTKAEGNPFFVEEVIRSLLDAGLIIRENSRWKATKEIADIALPDTLAGVINARLDRLGDETKRVAQTAAVVGREFRFATLAAVSERPGGLDDALSELERRDLVREMSRVPDRVYRFKHALTRDAAYGSLLLKSRRDLHRRTAECLESQVDERVQEIGRHFLEAREHSRALPYLVEGADRAARAYSTQDAIDLYSRALEILEAAPNVALTRRAREGLGAALTFAGQAQQAVDNYHSMFHAAQEFGDQPMQVSALNKLGFVTAMMAGAVPEAEQHLVDAEQLARECNDLAGLAELHMTYCYLRTTAGDFDDAYGHLSESAEIGNDLGAEEPKLFGMVHIANTLCYMTKFDESWEKAQEARIVAEEAGNQKWLS
ncbi:MAG: AAA family ATPase, partial [Chloroflexi bacterium]|nr:AAA family ATPase [Chloroflexota bacterium]